MAALVGADPASAAALAGAAVSAGAAALAGVPPGAAAGALVGAASLAGAEALAAARSSARLGLLRTGSAVAFSTERRQSLHETWEASGELCRLVPVLPHATLPSSGA
ncbi:hypothetical protein GFK94_10915 [Pseudomonas balearica]|nr:hypothetical protein [Stutzerimonas balearica]MBK3826573.1 hypothetical protein [Stutzerimonas balearica]MBK3856263.1 hypothetical protein [Stutzerimonas balearica]